LSSKPCHEAAGYRRPALPRRTSDPLASGDWYARVLGFANLLIEEHENDVVAVRRNIRAVPV
jgi:hypothetical protein